MVFPVVQLCGITTGIPHDIFVRVCAWCVCVRVRARVYVCVFCPCIWLLLG